MTHDWNAITPEGIRDSIGLVLNPWPESYLAHAEITTVLDPTLEVIKPIGFGWIVDGGLWMMTVKRFPANGVGRTWIEALRELQEGFVELYAQLEDEQDCLGPGALETWTALQQHLRRRDTP